MQLQRLLIVPLVALTSVCAQQSDNRGASVLFINCSEFVGFGPVPAASALPLVPAGFAATPFPNSSAGLVVRASSCRQVMVDGHDEGPGTVAHVGINIATPDGTGDINNYTVFYITTSDRLAQRLQRIGLPALVDRNLVYEVTPNPPGAAGELYSAMTPPEMPAYFLSGTVGDPPPNSAFPFLANWWYSSRRGVVKMATNIPAIAFGSANVTVHTSRNSPLGRLIGGNRFSNFSFLAVRGVFTLGEMEISLRP